MIRQIYKKPLHAIKILNIGTIIFAFLPSILFCFLQRIISPFIKIRIGRLRNQFYGHFLLESDFYLSHNSNNKEKYRKIDIFYFDGNSSNIFYQDLLRKHLYVLPKIVLQLAYFFNLYLFKNKDFLIMIPDRLTNLTELDEYNPSRVLFPLKNYSYQHFEYNSKRPSVIFCLRDSRKSQDSFSLRNVKIETYYESIDLLISKDYDVYILTDSYIEHRSKQMVKRINRDSSEMAIAGIEFFLARNCNFAVTTDSGSFHLPYLFRKPIILTNICGPIGDIESRFIRLKTYKKWVNLDSGDNIDFSEFGAEVLFDNDQAFKDNNIGLIDSTHCELRETIKYFLEIL